MPQTSAELEQRAERAVRRGELLAALELFETLLADQPEDERVRQRMESVRALLQPSELVNRRRAEPEEAVGPAAELLSDAEQGELHASSGRFREATASYERAVAKNPRNELLRERLEELRSLAPPEARADLHEAERLEEIALTPARGTQPLSGQRSARASDAAFGPLKVAPPRAPAAPRGASLASTPPAAEPSPAQPQDAAAFLRKLLERIRSARRA